MDRQMIGKLHPSTYETCAHTHYAKISWETGILKRTDTLLHSSKTKNFTLLFGVVLKNASSWHTEVWSEECVGRHRKERTAIMNMTVRGAMYLAAECVTFVIISLLLTLTFVPQTQALQCDEGHFIWLLEQLETKNILSMAHSLTTPCITQRFDEKDRGTKAHPLSKLSVVVNLGDERRQVMIRWWHWSDYARTRGVMMSTYFGVLAEWARMDLVREFFEPQQLGWFPHIASAARPVPRTGNSSIKLTSLRHRSTPRRDGRTPRNFGRLHGWLSACR